MWCDAQSYGLCGVSVVVGGLKSSILAKISESVAMVPERIRTITTLFTLTQCSGNFT